MKNQSRLQSSMDFSEKAKINWNSTFVHEDCDNAGNANELPELSLFSAKSSDQGTPNSNNSLKKLTTIDNQVWITWVVLL